MFCLFFVIIKPSTDAGCPVKIHSCSKFCKYNLAPTIVLGAGVSQKTSYTSFCEASISGVRDSDRHYTDEWINRYHVRRNKTCKEMRVTKQMLVYIPQLGKTTWEVIFVYSLRNFKGSNVSGRESNQCIEFVCRKELMLQDWECCLLKNLFAILAFDWHLGIWIWGKFLSFHDKSGLLCLQLYQQCSLC